MNKLPKIVVPHGIKYISEWTDYKLPLGHIIVDKGVTGCGYTEFCLTNDNPVILCSPRKLLLENKNDQHQKRGDWNILYLENKNDKRDPSKFNKEEQENGFDLEKEWKNLIYFHLQKCQGANENYEVRTPKFMVTYDSLGHLLKCLQDLQLNLGSFYFIVDEFQSIFLDAFFKASTEFNFVENLQICPNVIYLSATPMLDEYLDRIDEFKDLSFQEIDWNQTGYVETVKILSKKIKSISTECSRIIEKFKKGDFKTGKDSFGKVIESKEAVFYLNSVTDIIRIIKKSKLSPSEVNIICANTQENKNKLNKLSKDLGYDVKKGEGFTIGKVPRKDEVNKKYTFCTRSVYIGADFYSDCASSYVFADPNIECLALDISLDLPQIVGRQRNRNNPFKNNITIFYKTNENVISWEEFCKLQEKRTIATNELINFYYLGNNVQRVEYLKKIRSDIQVSQYSGDFVSISSKTGLPVHNKFIEIANERAWKVSQRDYQDRITVTKSIENQGYTIGENYAKTVVQEFSVLFESTNLFPEKLRIYCDYLDLYINEPIIYESIKFSVKDPDFQKFYEHYGSKGCKAKEYRKIELEKEFQDAVKEDINMVYTSFIVGEKYTLKEVKSVLSKVYSSQGLNKSPKASDLENYFELSPVLLTNPKTKKREHGYKIVKRK